MIFRVFLLFFLGCCAYASPSWRHLDSRQARSAILTNLETLGKSTDKATSELKSWNGEASSVATIISATDALKRDMMKASAEINPTEPFGLIAAVTIILPAQTLDGKVEELMEAVIAKKEAFTKIGSDKQIRDVLADLYANFNVLQASIVSKFQDIAIPVAEAIAQSFSDKVEAAWEAYGGEGAVPPGA